jgi:hypothetical protein
MVTLSLVETSGVGSGRLLGQGLVWAVSIEMSRVDLQDGFQMAPGEDQ